MIVGVVTGAVCGVGSERTELPDPGMVFEVVTTPSYYFLNQFGRFKTIAGRARNYIEITDLSKSTMFVDAGGEGLKHRTAWAGAGDEVLFFDVGPNGTPDGLLTEKREYVFTKWDKVSG